MKKRVFVSIGFFCLFYSLFAMGTADVAQSKAIERVVSLSPSITETMYALDAENLLVARTDFCNWPPEVADIPSAGGFDGKAISMEKIVSFRPDLVCLTKGMHDHLEQPLTALGIQIFVSSAESVEGILQEIQDLALLLNRNEKAVAVVKKIRDDMDTARTLVETAGLGIQGKTVYWEISQSPYFTCGKTSFISDVLTSIGLENIFSDVEQPYPQVSEESIIARNPDFIIFPDYALQGDSGVSNIKNRIGWNKISAVEHDTIYPVDADLFSRPGPRLGDMAILLAQLVTDK